MDAVEQIRQTASLLEIASQYTTLRKRGSKYVGLCPFHSERDPSFTVDPDKQLYHCFGCGVGGDIFALVMEKESLNFPEAVKYLADRFHIPLPRPGRAEAQAHNLEEKLLKITEEALAFFKRNLHASEEGKKALDYLQGRGLTEETLQKLKIGYAPNSWNALFSFFQAKDVPADLLLKAGLILPGQKSGGWYDRFRGRVMFPIFSLTGKVAAFGGRTIWDQEPKYLNSPETPLYSKSKILYGLNFTKEAVREKGELILVEGYTDFTGLYQAGFSNCAASLGTSLTPSQVSLARRFAPRIIVNYDGDAAGRSAALRAVALCLEQGLGASVVVLPGNSDPDSFIRQQGPDRYRGLLEDSPSGLEFLINMTVAGRKLDTPEAKAKAVREVVSEVNKVPDAILRSEYLKQVCEHFGLKEELLRNIVQEEPRPASGPGGPVQEKSDFLPAEKRLLQILVGHPDLAPYVFTEVREEDFAGLAGEPVFLYLQEWSRQEKPVRLSELNQKVGVELSRRLARALIEAEEAPTVEEALDCLFALRRSHLQKQLEALQAEIVRLDKKGDRDKVAALLFQKQDLTKQILSL
ncbi:MAG TPA: DNA primase [Acidobacteriota bacterium]